MQLVSASTKLRQMFYRQIERRSFHTAWVKTGKAQCEQMFSAVHPITDIAKMLRMSASRQKWSVASTFLGEPDYSVGMNNTLAIERRGGRGGGGPPMSARPVDRGQRPWNKGLLIGQKKPLEPKHVWSIRVRLEIARSRRDLVIFNLAIDSKLRACDLVKLRLDDVCSGVKVRHRATIVQKKTGRPVQFEITEQSRSSVEACYQCSARPVPVISSQVDFMQVLTYQPANMPGWCIAGLKASA